MPESRLRSPHDILARAPLATGPRSRPPDRLSERRLNGCPGKEKAMTHAQQMLETHPRTVSIDAGALLACIDACFDCAQSCTACADGCLGEDDVAMVTRCIRLCQDCGDVCTATGRVMSRQTEFVPELARAIVEACAQACGACAAECERHADHHDHCRVCAEACRRCEDSCQRALSALDLARQHAPAPARARRKPER